MKALITGGAGFIGSHLAERLLKDGHEVSVIDNLSTGSLENIKGFRKHSSFSFVEGDIRNVELMESFI
jgi:UDP-glucose 4-epimerase